MTTVKFEGCELCVLGRAAGPERCPFRDIGRKPGAVLLRQGEVPDAVWYVREGLVLVSSSDEGGAETSCALRGPGALLGLETLLGAPLDYEAWALSEVVVCRLGADDLESWAASRGSASRGLLQLALEESVRRQKERIALRGRAVSRLARFLVERDARPEGAGPLEIEHQVLARMLGMRAETLSRALAQLRSQGAIANTRSIMLADRERLTAIAGAETDPE